MREEILREGGKLVRLGEQGVSERLCWGSLTAQLMKGRSGQAHNIGSTKSIPKTACSDPRGSASSLAQRKVFTPGTKGFQGQPLLGWGWGTMRS